MNRGHSTPNDPWEASLLQAARNFPYPPTPDIASRLQARLAAGRELAPPSGRGASERRFAWGAGRAALLRFALAALLLLLALLSVPSVRAALVEYLQIGPVRIFLSAPTPEPPLQTAAPTPTLLPSLLEIDGRTTFESALSRLEYPVDLPAYPDDLGLPDYVFLQDMDGPVLILAWDDPDRPGEAGLSLHKIPQGSFAVDKFKPQAIQTTTVNGQTAIWTSGPYLMRLKGGELDVHRLVNGHALIWQQGDFTYRLETSLPLEEALKIASSLQEYPNR